jgi:predicted DNA-binding transcriptional regulator AlpA
MLRSRAAWYDAMIRRGGSSRAAIVPRGLARAESAHYVGVGLTKFDEMVCDGRMPKPVRIDGRVVWDRYRLDDAFEALSDQGDRDPWEEDAA